MSLITILPVPSRPGITFAVDWVLKTNYLSIYLPVPFSFSVRSTNDPACLPCAASRVGGELDPGE